MINLFIQCSHCMDELRTGRIHLSPEEYAKISVGLTNEHKLEVWCERHRVPVLSLSLNARQRKLFGHEVCEVCKCTEPPNKQ